MNNQTTDRLGIYTNCPREGAHYTRPGAGATATIDLSGCSLQGPECGDAIRRLRVGREGILDMLVKGRGSGLWL